MHGHNTHTHTHTYIHTYMYIYIYIYIYNIAPLILHVDRYLCLRVGLLFGCGCKHIIVFFASRHLCTITDTMVLRVNGLLCYYECMSIMWVLAGGCVRIMHMCVSIMRVLAGE